MVKLKPFKTRSAHKCHETFSFMMSLPAMSLGLRFCVSRKGRTGGGGWVHPKGANSMAMSGLGCEGHLVGAGWTFFLVLSSVNRPRKQSVTF